jgi:phosphoglucomutase
MAIDPRAGQMPQASDLVDVEKLVRAYYDRHPDVSVPEQRVAFGTSGHRGSAFDTTFNEDHILATTQAICLYRRSKDINGPLFVGRDTHALSGPAFQSALEVLLANGVVTMIDNKDGFTPTPVISHAIITHNEKDSGGKADGIVITPSHNPPTDGGFKYNPPHGGPAETEITRWIETKANEILAGKLKDVKRIPFERAKKEAQRHDYIDAYTSDLINVVEIEAIRAAGVRVGIDPLGGAAVGYWAPIIDMYGIDATVVNTAVDPTFRFVPLDWDGKIRMDCSSPYAMTKMLAIKDKFDVAFANDTDADRHGIVCKSGLMQPNDYLAVSMHYLRQRRDIWPIGLGIGKTIVSSSMIDRVASKLGAPLYEVPVGFKYFVEGLAKPSLFFGGEESAGSSFLRRNGKTWTTDKDGLIAGLLAAEITAATGKDPAEYYKSLTKDLGETFYARSDNPANAEQKKALSAASGDAVTQTTLAGSPIRQKLTKAPGNGDAFGGLKVISDDGWFAARPSGTEEVYKIYGESFKSDAHLKDIQDDARKIVAGIFQSRV